MEDKELNHINIDDDEHNEIELNKTLWVTLRKTKPFNKILKKFHSETQSYSLKVKDIVKFGRVNFKITALKCKRLNPNI